jgi:hypothetical protein
MKFHRLASFSILMISLVLPSAWAGQSTRQKVIDFDGDVVEGVNKRPFDSLNEAIDGNRKSKKIHLYRKRKGFRTETQETIREMRYL